MPAGVPPAELRLDLKVQAFSIDTCIIQEAGFRLTGGRLGALSKQLPPLMRLVISQVVVDETRSHWAATAKTKFDKLESAHADLRRFIGPQLDKFVPDIAEHFSSAARAFASELTYFIDSHSGLTLAVSVPNLAHVVMERYFASKPPFGTGDKKHEFPDAFALMEIEEYAKQREIHVVAVSNDGGWLSFADQSPHIYCVRTIEELTAMFEAADAEVAQLTSRIEYALSRDDSLHERVMEVLRERVPRLQFREARVERYGRGMVGYARSVEAKSFRHSLDQPRVWRVDPGSYLAFVPVRVVVEASLLLMLDAHEMLPTEVRVFEEQLEQEIETKLILSFKEIMGAEPVSAALLSIDIADETYSLDISPFADRRMNPWSKVPLQTYGLDWGDDDGSASGDGGAKG